MPLEALPTLIGRKPALKPTRGANLHRGDIEYRPWLVAREQRLVFGEDAELYDRARPTYPAELIDDVVGLVGNGSHAVDAGCGTGKATVLLAARGLDGVAVDPDPAMAAVARRHLDATPVWRVEVSSFETWSPARDDPPIDLLVSAQAWHWFDPEVRFQKAYGLLRPGGWMALWWNGPAVFDTPARRAIDAAYQAFAPEIVHRGIAGHPVPDFEPMPLDAWFGAPLQRSYPWTKRYSAATWCDLLRTSSDHRMLAEDRRERLLEAVTEAIESNGGTYDHPYVCGLWAAQRL